MTKWYKSKITFTEKLNTQDKKTRKLTFIISYFKLKFKH